MQKQDQSSVSPEDALRVLFRYFGTVLLFAFPCVSLCGFALLLIPLAIGAGGAGGMLSGLAGMILFCIGAALGLVVAIIIANWRLGIVFDQESDPAAKKCLDVITMVETIIGSCCFVFFIFLLPLRDDATHWYRSRFDPPYQLGQAIYADDLKQVDRLLDHSFTVDVLPWNAINDAHDVAIFQLLLDHGYSIDHSSEYVDSALLNSIARGDEKMVSFLLEHDVDPNVRWNQNVFIHAMDKLDDTQECLSMFNVLFEHDISPEVSSGRETLSPLIDSTEREDSETLIFALLDHGADIDRQGYNGETPLLRAVDNEHVGECKALISRKANLDLANDDGETPLFWAVMRGNREMVNALLEAGANPSIATKEGVTPLQYAKSQNEKDHWIIWKLQKCGSKK